MEWEVAHRSPAVIGLGIRGGISWLFRVVLAFVFVWAGVVKLDDPAGFAGSIATFQLLPETWINIVAFGLPPFEVLMGLLVLTSRGLAVASLALGGLSLMFLVALLSGLARGLPVDCGCFGAGGPSSPGKIWMAVVRDLLLVGMAGRARCYSTRPDKG